MANTSPMGPSSDEKIMAGFAYVGQLLCFIPTVIIFFMKKDESDFIKFHCLQSFSFIIYGLISFVINIVFSILMAVVGQMPGVGMIMGLGGTVIFGLLGLAVFCYWVFLMIKAFMGEDTKIPYVGALIEEKMM